MKYLSHKYLSTKSHLHLQHCNIVASNQRIIEYNKYSIHIVFSLHLIMRLPPIFSIINAPSPPSNPYLHHHLNQHYNFMQQLVGTQNLHQKWNRAIKVSFEYCSFQHTVAVRQDLKQVLLKQYFKRTVALQKNLETLCDEVWYIKAVTFYPFAIHQSPSCGQFRYNTPNGT